PDALLYGERADVMRFGAEVAERRALDAAWVQAALSQSRYIPSVARLIMPPEAGTAKNWAAYRARFLEPRRIAAGLAVGNANEAWLQLAEERYGVPPEIVVGIVGVETIYGQQMGNFRIADALATLAFNFPEAHPRAKERSQYFRGELEHFLVMQDQAQGDPLKPLGSYAGAMGMPQFMPSSWA